MPTDLEEFVNINVIPKPDLDSFAFQNVIPLSVHDATVLYNVVPLPNLDQFVNVNIELLYGGPHWFGVDAGDVQWMPGLIWNGTEFVRYQMWDGTNWQISVGHDTT